DVVEVLRRVKGDGFVRELVQRQRFIGQDADGITIVGRIGTGATGYIHPSARAIFDNHGLTPALLQLIAKGANEDVAGPAGAVAGIAPPWLRGLRLGLGRRRAETPARSTCEKQQAQRFHRSSASNVTQRSSPTTQWLAVRPNGRSGRRPGHLNCPSRARRRR